MTTIRLRGQRYFVRFTLKGLPVSIQLLKANGKPQRAVSLSGDLGREIVQAAKDKG